MLSVVIKFNLHEISQEHYNFDPPGERILYLLLSSSCQNFLWNITRPFSFDNKHFARYLVWNSIQMKSHAVSHLCKSYQIEKESDTFMTRLDFYLQKKDLWNGETWWINSCLFKNSMGARKVDPIRVSSLKCMMNVKVHFWNSFSKINSQVQCQRSCNMLLLLSVLPNDKRPYRVYF